MFAITERLLLRPSWPEDAEALHAAIADRGIVRNLASVPWPYSLDDAAQFAALQHDAHFPAATLWTRDGKTPRLVGTCGLAEYKGEVEIGYWIARPFWGQGYATEAGRAMVQAARAMGHKRLVSGHFADNPASGRVLRKIGFRPTGRVEMRQSRARSHAAPSLLFECTLDGAKGAGSSDAAMDANKRVVSRSEFARIAA